MTRYTLIAFVASLLLGLATGASTANTPANRLGLSQAIAANTGASPAAP